MPTTMDPTAQKNEAQDEIPQSSVYHPIERIDGQRNLRKWFLHDFSAAGLIHFIPKFKGKMGKFKGDFVARSLSDSRPAERRCRRA